MYEAAAKCRISDLFSAKSIFKKTYSGHFYSKRAEYLTNEGSNERRKYPSWEAKPGAVTGVPATSA